MTWKQALTPEQELELVEEYKGVNDWTINELSVMFKVSHRTVYRVLSKHGASRTKPSRTGRDGKGKFVAKRTRKRPKLKSELKPCGTVAAYRRHLYRKEYPCTACLAANAKDVRDRKNKK